MIKNSARIQRVALPWQIVKKKMAVKALKNVAIDSKKGRFANLNG